MSNSFFIDPHSIIDPTLMNKSRKPTWSFVGGQQTAAPQIIVSPSYFNDLFGSRCQFTATVLNASNREVIWSSDYVVGGSIENGTIDNTGFWTSFSDYYSNQYSYDFSHTITATLVADSNIQGTAGILINYGYFNVRDNFSGVFINRIYHITSDYKINIWNAALQTDTYWVDCPITDNYADIIILAHINYIFITIANSATIYYRSVFAISTDPWLTVTTPTDLSSGVYDQCQYFIGTRGFWQHPYVLTETSDYLTILCTDHNTQRNIVAFTLPLTSFIWNDRQDVYTDISDSSIHLVGYNKRSPGYSQYVYDIPNNLFFTCYDSNWNQSTFPQLPQLDYTKPCGAIFGNQIIVWGVDLNASDPNNANSIWILNYPILYPIVYNGQGDPSVYFVAGVHEYFGTPQAELLLNKQDIWNNLSVMLTEGEFDFYIGGDGTNNPSAIAIGDTLTLELIYTSNIFFSDSAAIDVLDESSLVWSVNSSWQINSQNGVQVTIQRLDFDNIGFNATCSFNVDCQSFDRFYGYTGNGVQSCSVSYDGIYGPYTSGVLNGSYQFSTCNTIIDNKISIGWPFSSTSRTLPNDWVGNFTNLELCFFNDTTIIRYSPDTIGIPTLPSAIPIVYGIPQLYTITSDSPVSVRNLSNGYRCGLFTFNGTIGDILNFYAETLDHTGTITNNWDDFMIILDSNRNPLITVDDNGPEGNNYAATLSGYSLPYTGIYFVDISPFNPSNIPNTFKLHITKTN